MRKLSLLLALTLLLTGCTPEVQPEKKQYTATFLELFDTVTTVVGLSDSKEAFTETANAIRDELKVYHQLFDIYNDYDGVANLKTINDNAGLAPVKVDAAIIALLTDCVEYYRLTGGRVNVAMGSVLEKWHNARSSGLNDPVNAKLPDMAELTAAAEHCDIEDIVIDAEASTVYLADPAMRLDVGAVAKGWATQRVAENAPEGLLISVGGNVCATGPKTDGGDPWVVGLQDPDGDEYIHTIYVTGGCVVTSGDYQRTYMVDGQTYHHIIDPDTLMPGEYWRSVTIVCLDSALADALSTALFLMDMDAGQAILDECNAVAMWVDAGGNVYYSPGFNELIRT